MVGTHIIDVIIDVTDNPVVCSCIFSFVTSFVGGRLYSLIEIRAIKEVAVISITEQLATGDYIKIGPDL